MKCLVVTTSLLLSAAASLLRVSGSTAHEVPIGFTAQWATGSTTQEAPGFRAQEALDSTAQWAPSSTKQEAPSYTTQCATGSTSQEAPGSTAQLAPGSTEKEAFGFTSQEGPGSTVQWARGSTSQWATGSTSQEAPGFFAPTSDEFSRQVARLISNDSISEERLQRVPLVLQHLESVLNTRWPGSRVIVFGSLVYGLGMTNSDVDCILILPHRTDMSHALIQHATNTLRQYPTLFADLYPIDWVRIPVVTFKHIPTQFKVDLTINNFAGVQVSNLLRYLLHLDEQIYKFTFIVRRWASVRKLTDIRSLNSYGLTLMTIFYMQQRNMMPPITTLQLNAKPFFENEWNLGFYERDYNIQKDVPLYLLLGDFFAYYADFDYDNYIVSPYIGYPIEKRLFADLNHVPNEFDLYKYNVRYNVSKPISLASAFVLQDVFIHNGNVAERVDMRPNSTFITEFQRAAKKFHKSNTSFLKKILKKRNNRYIGISN